MDSRAGYGGRWYPALVTLGDGRIVAISGDSDTGPKNRTPEIFSPTSGWTPLPTSTQDWPLYPHLFLLRDGKLFFTGENAFGTGVSPGKLDLTTNTITPTPICMPKARGIRPVTGRNNCNLTA